MSAARESTDRQRRVTRDAFPDEWGKPPERRNLGDWIRDNMKLGRERRARGEKVPWLAPEKR